MENALTLERLKGESGRREPYFTREEANFLRRYAPTHFSNDPLETLLLNKHAQIELNQKVFDVMVKLDISVARKDTHLESLLREKGFLLNPIFSAFGLEQVPLGAEVHKSLYELKQKGLRILSYTTPKNPDLIQRTVETTDKFMGEKDQLLGIFGDIPMIIYGSALIKPNPSDIDSMVFPKSLDAEIYKMLEGKYRSDMIAPLSFVVMPIDYLVAFSMSDTHDRFRSENSLMLNGTLNTPIIPRPYLEDLKAHQLASDYIKLRSSLTEVGLKSCRGILPRINAYLKKPKFMYSNLGLRGTVPEPIIQAFEDLPDRKELVDALSRANLACYELFTQKWGVKLAK